MAIPINNNDIINNLAANLIWTIAAVIFVYLFKNPIIRAFRRVWPKIDSKIPHIDFSAVYKPSQDYKSDITIKNAGGEPAYNVYVFLFVEFPGDGGYSIQSLGAEGVRSGVLGIGETIKFKDKSMLFDGCDITCRNEVWVEFSNVAGVHFRTVVLPPSPRGDDWRMLPPKVIKKRLSQIPGFHGNYPGASWKKLEQGKRDLPEFTHKYPLKTRMITWSIIAKQKLRKFRNKYKKRQSK